MFIPKKMVQQVVIHPRLRFVTVWSFSMLDHHFILEKRDMSASSFDASPWISVDWYAKILTFIQSASLQMEWFTTTIFHQCL